MAFGIDFGKLAMGYVNDAVAKLKKIDENHNGIPDLVELQNDVTAATADLQALEAKITPTEMAAALNLLFPGKFTADEIAKGEAALGKLTAVESQVAAFMAQAKTVL